MKFNKVNGFIIVFFMLPVVSCNNKSDNSIFNEYDVHRFNLISNYSANTLFNKETSSEISPKDYADRQNNCSFESPEIQNQVKGIIEAYSNKNLLDHSNTNSIPALTILTKTRNLTSSNAIYGHNLYSCYYPELYLANALIMNVLQSSFFSF